MRAAVAFFALERQRREKFQLGVNDAGVTSLSLRVRERGWGIASKIIYADTQHGRIEILPAVNGEVSPYVPMGNQLNVPLYLRIQKFNYAGSASDDATWITQANARKEICKRLAKEISALTPLISDINRMAMNAVKEVRENGKKDEILAYPEQELRAFPRNEEIAVLKMMSAAGLINWKEGSKLVQFTDIGKLRFLRGG